MLHKTLIFRQHPPLNPSDNRGSFVCVSQCLPLAVAREWCLPIYETSFAQELTMRVSWTRRLPVRGTGPRYSCIRAAQRGTHPRQ